MKLNSRQLDFWRRLSKGDPYAIRKAKANIQRHISNIFARQVVARKEKLKTYLTVSDYIGLRKQYELNYDLFFDKPFYERQCGQDFATQSDAIEHFKSHFLKGYNPHPLFDTKYYLAQVGGIPGGDPVSHLLSTVDRTVASPTPFFKRKFYLSKNPDVAQSKMDPFIHFMRYGRGELRNPHPLVDFQYYLSRNADVNWSNIDPLSHYVSHGYRAADAAIHPILNAEFIREQAAVENPQAYNQDPFLLYTDQSSPRRIDPSPLFDTAFYNGVLRSMGIGAPDPDETELEHYLRVNSKDVVLETSPIFSSRDYWRENPDIGEINPLYHFLRYGNTERRAARLARLDFLDPNVQAVVEIEPTLLAPHQAQDMIWSTIYPNMSHPGYAAIKGMLEDCKGFAPTHVFLLSSFRRGGAEKINHKLMQAILDESEEAQILVYCTDRQVDEAREWCPVSSRLRTTTLMHEPEIAEDQAIATLARVLLFLSPQQVINCNSRTGWQVYRDYGRPLSTCMKLRASLFCYDHDVHGRKVGYARDFLRDTLEYLDLVFVDNDQFRRDLVSDFSICSDDAARIKVMYQLAEESAPGASPDLYHNVKSPRILWPMRFHRQKRPDIFCKVARAMPDVQFFAWIPGSRWDNNSAVGSRPDNVNVLPDTGSRFSDLDTSSFCGMLSTSQWEGLPTVLIEAAQAGIPCIASLVGGVGEVLNDATGYPVHQFDDVDAYVAAIRSLIADPAAATAKSAVARANIEKQHGKVAYFSALHRLGFLPKKPAAKAANAEGVTKKKVASKKRGSKVGTQRPRSDVAIVVNAHREGNLLAPTLRSVEIARAAAVADGISCSVAIILDSGDDKTRKVIAEFAPKGSRVEEISVGDLGEARNAAVAFANHAEFLAFVDGDDLFSRNWVREAYRCARSWKRDCVWHPFTNYIFGRGDTYAFNHRDMDHFQFSLDYLLVTNYWSALSFAKRDLYARLPYERNAIKEGWGYEDWGWNARTIASGIKHKIVPHTAHFIRRKTVSLLNETNARANLPRIAPLRDMMLNLQADSRMPGDNS